MELIQQRTDRTGSSTIGDFSVDGVWFAFGLEPVDRGLTSAMDLATIASIKIQDKTAIPTGRYQITKYFSPRHQFDVPLVNNVPGFEGVEIHVGNYPKDTDGCLLLGSEKTTDMVENSTITIAHFYQQFFAAINNGEEVWITYS